MRTHQAKTTARLNKKTARRFDPAGGQVGMLSDYFCSAGAAALAPQAHFSHLQQAQGLHAHGAHLQQAHIAGAGFAAGAQPFLPMPAFCLRSTCSPANVAP